jgi:hypothetical protein
LESGAPSDLIAICENVDPMFFYENSEVVSATSFVQKKRNEYLRTNVHGDRFLDTDMGKDPVKKDLMRVAAMVSFASNSVPPTDVLTREDTLEGLEFLSIALNQLQAGGHDVASLRDWLATQRGGRGTVREIAAEEYLLLCEIIFDKAINCVRPTALDRVRRIIDTLDQ